MRAETRSGALIAGIAASLLFVLSCSEPERDAGDLSFLRGRIFTTEKLYVFPGRSWKASGDLSMTFAESATIYCFAPAALSESVVFSLRPNENTSGRAISVEWDGDAVLEGPVKMDGGLLEVAIEPRLLSAGLHRLRIDGADAWEAEALYSFEEIGYRIGSKEERLSRAESSRYEYLHDFFRFGLTGANRQKMNGFVFDGAQPAAVPLPIPRNSRFSVTAENGAGGPARFSIWLRDRVHEQTLGPRETAMFDIPLPSGKLELTFRVDGPEGFYLWGAPHLRQEDSKGLPPIVLITLDTTRRDALTPYGGRAAVTPRIARFAEGATVYENAYATSPWTLPSHTSIFTGFYPSRHRAGAPARRIPERLTTLAELLGRRGYLTAGFAGGYISSLRFGLGQGFDLFRDPDHFETRGHRLTDRVIDFLMNYREHDLFLFVNYFDPHLPYQAPDRFATRFGFQEAARRLEAIPIWRDVARGDHAAWERIVAGEAEASAAAHEYMRAGYLAEVAFMDHHLGNLLRALEVLGLYDRALIALVGDHGELLGENGYYSHSGRLDPELVAVPLIVKYPHQKASRRVDGVVSIADLFPTILSIAGFARPPVDGEPLHRSRKQPTGRRVFMEEHYVEGFHAFPPHMHVADHLYGIQSSDSREIVWEGGNECFRRGAAGWEPVSCETDPAARLAAIESAFRTAEAGSEEDTPLGGEELEALRALGYVR